MPAFARPFHLSLFLFFQSYYSELQPMLLGFVPVRHAVPLVGPQTLFAELPLGPLGSGLQSETTRGQTDFVRLFANHELRCHAPLA